MSIRLLAPFASVMYLTVVQPSAAADVACPTAAPAAVSAGCAACHGLDGHGTGSGRPSQLVTPDIAGMKYEYSLRAFASYRLGNKWLEDPDSVVFTEGMRVHDEMGTAVGSLSEQDLQDVAAWYSCQK